MESISNFPSDADADAADAADAGSAAGTAAAKLVFRRLDFDNKHPIPFERIRNDLKKCSQV